jgi:hypothetical protein
MRNNGLTRIEVSVTILFKSMKIKSFLWIKGKTKRKNSWLQYMGLIATHDKNENKTKTVLQACMYSHMETRKNKRTCNDAYMNISKSVLAIYIMRGSHQLLVLHV